MVITSFFLGVWTDNLIPVHLYFKLIIFFIIKYAGKESLVEWIEDPSYPNTTLSWNIVHGNEGFSAAIICCD